jgi:hypothetical protein
MSPKPATGHFLIITNPDYCQYIELTVFFRFVDSIFSPLPKIVVFTSLPEKYWLATKQRFLALEYSHLIIVAQIQWRTASKVIRRP